MIDGTYLVWMSPIPALPLEWGREIVDGSKGLLANAVPRLDQMLPSALGVAISPIPIAAVVLMLLTGRSRANGAAFIVGWVSGLALVGALVFSIASTGATNGVDGSPQWLSIAALALGPAFLLAALKHWRERPRGRDLGKTPKWMEALEEFSPVKAEGAGVLLSPLNPKNLAFSVVAATAIGHTSVSRSPPVAGYAVFVLSASIGIGAPMVISLALGDRSAELLKWLNNWLARNNAAIMASLLLVIGVKLIGDGLRPLELTSRV